MQGNDVDRLSDDALAKSKQAFATHSDDAHKAASQAHQAAYRAADSAGRPSLAQSHLQQAAQHDRHADATTYEGKASVAHRATQTARATGKPEDHDKAANAHQDAADVRPSAFGRQAMGGPDHTMAQMQHQGAARIARAPKPTQGGPVDVG